MTNDDFIQNIFLILFSEEYKEKNMSAFEIQEMFTKDEVLEELIRLKTI